MLRSFVTWFSLLMMATALTACCGSTACECDDRYADAISLQFDTVGTATSSRFLPEEIRTVYLVRGLLRDTAKVPRLDTVQLIRPLARVNRQPIIITNTTPFAQAGNRKLDSYRYELYLAPGPERPHSFDFVIDSVQLKTDFRAEGCCTCFENSSKLIFSQQVQPNPFDLTDKDGNNQLKPLTIVRKR